jgi:NADPH2:quinone reductase
MPDLVRSTHETLIHLYQAGEIDPLIYQTVPFDDLPQALNLLGSRSTYGKLIANPGD